MSITLLINIQQEITHIGYTICFFIGNFSGAIGLFVFLQKPMRRIPCAMFLIAYMVTNMLYINFTIFLSILNTLFQINPTIQSLTFCRLDYYISFVLAVIPPYLLVMASVDRSFASSRNVHTRSRSTQRFATLMIGLICIFWMIFHIHAFFTVDIQLFNEQPLCTFLQGVPTTFVTYYNLICVGIIPLSLMIGFGIRILMNIKQSRINRNHSYNNRRLILLLIVQVTIYLCLRLPTSLYLIYKASTKLNTKNSNQITIEQFIQSVVYFCQFIQISISPSLNFITKTFRNELKRALARITRRDNQSNSIDLIQMRGTVRRFN